jgi:predicted aspartyl protease
MSKKFSFTYFPYPAKDLKTKKRFEIFRPTVPIQISYNGSLSWPFQGLVDSGSDRNLFPAQLGELIGIRVKEGEERPIEGIGGHIVKTYTHKITLKIHNYEFKTKADFSYRHEVPLLGRDGFFNFFKRIDFKEKKRTLDFKY